MRVPPTGLAIPVLLVLTGCVPLSADAAQEPAWLRDRTGQIVDAAGNPLFATFSICAIDPATGQAGVAVTTRVPFVGRAVPWARAGVGAVATQAFTVVEYGAQALDLMAQGTAPAEAIERLLAGDSGRRTARGVSQEAGNGAVAGRSLAARLESTRDERAVRLAAVAPWSVTSSSVAGRF